MANTTNFGWETPDDTDLVKDGALAMRTLGNAIDTSLVDLKGGTTDQVLAKNSNTDMDFKWVTSDDANAIQNAIVDAKGDLIAASAADTPARLAVGNNGETLLADSSTTTGLRWQADFSVGRNKILNSDFGIWQRGTSFSNPASGDLFADRYRIQYDGTGATRTLSQQTFTPGAAPVAEYEGTFFFRYARTVAGSGATFDTIRQRIEDVRVFAGQTATLSFWAKVDSGTPTLTLRLTQNFGSGGSASVNATDVNVTLSTSWTRYTATFAVPSVSGKTIGAGSYLQVDFRLPLNTILTTDFWGVQLEAGSVATAFQTATGTLAGELQAAMRYYQRYSQTALTAQLIPNAGAVSTTVVDFGFPTQVPFRIKPGSLETVNVGVYQFSNATTYSNGTWSIANDYSAQNIPLLRYTHGSAVFTANNVCGLVTTSASNLGYIGLSAEL